MQHMALSFSFRMTLSLYILVFGKAVNVYSFVKHAYFGMCRSALTAFPTALRFEFKTVFHLEFSTSTCGCLKLCSTLAAARSQPYR
jgi:hypothetical protein